MAKMTCVTLCYNHFMIVQAWWWTPDDPPDSNLLGGTCFEMMLSNVEHHNITTSQCATWFPILWDSNDNPIERCNASYFKLFKLKWFVRLPHASFTLIAQIRLEDYWGNNGHFATDKLLVSLKHGKFLRGVPRAIKGADLFSSYDTMTSLDRDILKETTRMMLKKH